MSGERITVKCHVIFSSGEQDPHQHNDADADDVPRRDADRRDRLLPHVPGQKLDSQSPT